VQISQDLLGKVLCTNIKGQISKVIITETEAYAGINDKASHAHGGRRTIRTEPLYAKGGTAYVYLCYGIHHLFNVVTNEANTPHAVLIRAGKPLEGLQHMRNRRNREKIDRPLLTGPGTLTQALGITTGLTGVSLLENRVWIEDQQNIVGPESVIAGPRVGIDYAEEDAQLPYRFRVKISELSEASPYGTMRVQSHVRP
jgi:DNA-3-methyladenine glycosylase